MITLRAHRPRKEYEKSLETYDAFHSFYIFAQAKDVAMYLGI